MVHGVTPEIRKYREESSLTAAAAEDIVSTVRNVVLKKKVFTMALSGGTTPVPLYELLATRYRESIPWKSLHVFLVDERYVAWSDKDSNFKMIKEKLLDRVPIPGENIHPIDTRPSDPEASARKYESELRDFFPGKESRFDLILLGMGKEGHTASLFPGSSALDEKERWVMHVETPARPPGRITMTYPIINSAEAIYFLVSGEEKSAALSAALNPKSDFHEYPAAGVRPLRRNLVWWVDSAALVGGRRR